ncbi:MAG: phosphoribosylamine--glycine ligase [Deltaproteobacteria bacterium]|nr:phosphoribosylamine--glycine ligase [Deltaproteobacteria bacterium]
MNVLVVGGGGREHALVYKLKESKGIKNLFTAPGNAGTEKLSQNVNISPERISEIKTFCIEKKIDLVVVGPEDPLAVGIVDELSKSGIKVFGPGKRAAVIESSKVFAKEFMRRHNIPTADFRVFSNILDTEAYVEKHGLPIVIKADGLCAGKGTFVVHTSDELDRALDNIFIKKRFGEAGKRVVVEEKLSGEEASFFAISDGEEVLPLIGAQDHKPVFDEDKGPNTGGMGAYAPAPLIDETLYQKIMGRIIHPTIEGLKQEGIKYKGVLYAGLMIKDNEPYVLEFNCRFGDPETQPMTMLMESELLPVLLSSIEGGIEKTQIKWKNGYSVCVVLASGGYPGKYKKGKVIRGLEDVEKMEDVYVFHAGTKRDKGKIVTNGGRVLGITSYAEEFAVAQKRVYEAVEKIHFEGMHYRKDIGNKALWRLR